VLRKIVLLLVLLLPSSAALGAAHPGPLPIADADGSALHKPFPELLLAWRDSYRDIPGPALPDLTRLGLTLLTFAGLTFAVSTLLPRPRPVRSRRSVYARRAARAMSWMRWTIDLRPFER